MMDAESSHTKVWTRIAREPLAGYNGTVPLREPRTRDSLTERVAQAAEV